jgi:hypothetical protein
MTPNKEERWIITFAIVVMFLITLPYLIGYARQGDSWIFTGFMFGLEDGNSYIAKMLLGASGDWLFKTPYTAYKQGGFVAFLPYLLLGKLTAPPEQHLQLVVLFHLFRVAAGMFEIIITYRFLSLFISDVRMRRLGVAIISLGGGLGWLSILGLEGLWENRLPLEFYSPETFGFLSILGLPHLAAARGLLLGGLIGYLKPTQHKTCLFANGIWWVALGIFQPLTIIVGWVVIFGHLALLRIVNYFGKYNLHNSEEMEKWKQFLKRGILLITLSSPWVFYNGISFQCDQFLKGWADQNLILSPPMIDYLFAYSIFLPFAVLGIFIATREHRRQFIILASWITLLPLLAYAPYHMQRRLIEGGWVAIVILALLWLGSKSGWKKYVVAGLMSTSFLSPIILLIGGGMVLWSPSKPLFRPNIEIEVYEYLENIITEGDVVMAENELSNPMPAWIAVNTLIGHGSESINQDELSQKVSQYFNGNLKPDKAIEMLKEFQIKYIVLNKNSKVTDIIEDGAGDMYSRLDFQHDLYIIYQVRLCSLEQP